MAIWKRLKKSTPEGEAKFRERMSDENVPFTDKLIMVMTAFVVLLLPSVLILVGISLLVMWIFRIF